MAELPNQKLRANARRTELVWEGKYDDAGNLRPIERIALPFQVIETINQSRATREREPLLAGLPPLPLFEGEVERPSWRNKLVWGDNKYVLASLIEGDPTVGLKPMKGKINLIYIDPPFDTGDDFSFRVKVGDEEVAKQPSIIEQKAYNDTWGRSTDSYLQMMYERLVLMRDLLADNGSIYVHLDWHVGHYVKLLMDEIFGRDNFRNEIVWWYKRWTAASNNFQRMHDVILFYSKTQNYKFNQLFQSLASSTQAVHGDTRRINVLDESGRMITQRTSEPTKGVQMHDVWEIPFVVEHSQEQTGYDTQKPVELVGRIVDASTNEGDLVADFFMGSGATLAAAEGLRVKKEGNRSIYYKDKPRRWIGCDLGRFAIHTTRKRLLDIPDCKPFEILNLGKYERRYWQVNVINGGEKDDRKAVFEYLAFIVELYRAQPVVNQFSHLHGRKGGRMVHVGASDAPVTHSEIADALKECSANRFNALDVLGWEWEMGLHDVYESDARREGVDLRLLQIPREVMDRRAVEAGDVHFYELAHLETEIVKEGRTAQVRLRNFFIPNPELVPDDLKGKVKKWSDWIDYWAVDWDFKEDTFHNQWQSYRTRRHPSLKTESDPHTYQNPGSYKVLVKVVDIFGNDITKVVEIVIG